ncbi:MAG: LysR family transcriptional regulator [Gammaproteobacteria bacterium]|nr:LysR family transcriptional regulator [Gammaproteobacteria bacterium]
MVNWDDMRYLLAVARGGSMSAAARALKVNHATVIRRIRSLEHQLGSTLFDRIGHTYVITPAGQVAFDAAEQMEAESAAVERQIVGQVTELSGPIRVTAPEAMGRDFLLPALKVFTRRYPEILVDLSLSMRTYDLGLREADVAIRVTDQPPGDVVGRKITTLAMAVYGLAGTDLTAARIDRVISMAPAEAPLPEWAVRYCPRARASLLTDSPGLQADAIREGFGCARLPCGMGDLDASLQRVPDIPLEQGSQIWILTHVDVRTNARIRVFRDFMQVYFEERRDLLEGMRVNAAASA